MKKIFFPLLIASLISSPAFTQKVHFFKGTFDDALKEAAKTNRYVFVDVYTTWCKPCLQMDKEVFANAEVAATMNAFFINFKSDAEGVGKEAAITYNVKAYPTMLFVSPQGNVFQMVRGGLPKDVFLNIAKNVLYRLDYGQLYYRNEVIWAAGNREPEFVTDYLLLRKHYGLPNDIILGPYLESIPSDSLGSPQTEKMVILGVNETSGAGFDYLVAHKSSRRCTVKLNSLLTQLADRAVRDEDKGLFDEYLQLIGWVATTDWEAELKRGEFKARFFLETHDKEAFVLFANRFATEILLPNLRAETLAADSIRYAAHRLAMENIGWQYSRYIKNKATLQSAFDWLEQMNQVQVSIDALCYQAMIADKLGDDKLCCKKLVAAYSAATAQNRSLKQWDKMFQRCK